MSTKPGEVYSDTNYAALRLRRTAWSLSGAMIELPSEIEMQKLIGQEIDVMEPGLKMYARSK